MKLNRKAIDEVDWEVVNKSPATTERVAISAFIQELKVKSKRKPQPARPTQLVKD